MGLNELIQIGSKIKEIRKSKGISQKEMAKRLNIPYSTYSNYENNNREPSAAQIQAIAKELDIDVQVLIDINKEYSKLLAKVVEEDLKQWENNQLFGYSDILDIEILKDFDKLNKIGKIEARKRVQELTEIKKYTEPDNN